MFCCVAHSSVGLLLDVPMVMTADPVSCTVRKWDF